MKFILFCCLLTLQITSQAQSLYAYKDTVNGFFIGIPDKWKYTTTYDGFPELKLSVYNMDSSAAGRFPDNFNINIQNKQPPDIEGSYNKLLRYMAQNRLQLTDTGSYIVYGEKVRWFEEMHIGKKNNDTLCSSVFTVYSNSKTYIITCTSSTLRFPETRDIFHRVAQTFKTKLPPAYESLQIIFPEINAWSLVYETDDSVMHVTQIVPPGETAEKWTCAVFNMSYKSLSEESIEKRIERFATTTKKEFKESNFTLLSKTKDWALFKIERNRPEPESYLYYLVRGNSGTHVAFLSLKQAKLPADIVKKWSDHFRQAKFVTER